jgi:hypothetical protein
MRKIVKVVLVVVIFLTISVALITGLNLLFFWSAFDWFQGLIVIAGVNPLLAKSIASLLLAIVVMLPLGKMTLSLTPIPQKNKRLYRALIFVFIGIFFVFTYFGNRNIFFDPHKGVPLKYYSEVNGKIKIFSAPGFDPETGDSLLPVTKEVILTSKGIQLKKEVTPANRSQSAVQIPTAWNRPATAATSAHPVAKVKMETDSVVKKEIASQIDVAKSSRVGDQKTTLATPKQKDSVYQNNTMPRPPRQPKTLREILTGKIDAEISSQESKEEEYAGPVGYSISVVDNPELENLGNIFQDGDHYHYSHRFSSCRTELDNLSRGRFEFYDENKSLLVRIPAKKKMVLVLEPGYYYFKTEESFKFIPLHLPDRAKFNLKISEVRDMPTGEILIGGVSDLN